MHLADEFVRLTGFGNAAGLLQRRGLFGFGQVRKTISITFPGEIKLFRRIPTASQVTLVYCDHLTMSSLFSLHLI